MAAVYSTGISSSPTNLLQTVVSFLVTQGWTQDSSVSDGTGWRAHLHKSSLYVNLRSAMGEKIYPYDVSDYHDSYAGYGIGVYLGDGYSSGSSWIEQSGGPARSDGSVIGVGASLPSGSVSAYHLFDDGSDNIIVVVEKSPGLFCHFGFGPDMSEAGQPEDFPYCFGSSNSFRNVCPIADLGSAERYGVNVSALAPMSPADQDYRSTGGSPSYCHTNALVRVDATTFSGRWVGNGQGVYDGHGYPGRSMRCALTDDPNLSGTPMGEDDYISYRRLRDRVHQTAYAGGVLLPLHCFVLTDPDARFAPIGYPPSLYWCDIVGHGYGAGEIYSVGGVDYMVFPGFAVMKGA